MFIMIAFVIVIVFGNNVSANAASTGQCLLTTNDSGQQGTLSKNNATHCDRGTFLPTREVTVSLLGCISGRS